MDITKEMLMACDLDEDSSIRYASLFKEHEITRDLLSDLSLDALKAIGLNKVRWLIHTSP